MRECCSTGGRREYRNTRYRPLRKISFGSNLCETSTFRAAAQSNLPENLQVKQLGDWNLER